MDFINVVPTNKHITPAEMLGDLMLEELAATRAKSAMLRHKIQAAMKWVDILYDYQYRTVVMEVGSALDDKPNGDIYEWYLHTHRELVRMRNFDADPVHPSLMPSGMVFIKGE